MPYSNTGLKFLLQKGIAYSPDPHEQSWCALQLALLLLEERVETEGEKAGRVIGISVPHRHPVDEAFFFFGTNPKDPRSLQGEIEFWLGLGEDAEKFTFTKNTCIYVPAGLGHLPTRATRVDNPAQPIVMLVIHTASNWDIEEAIDDKGEPVYPPGWIIERRKP